MRSANTRLGPKDRISDRAWATRAKSSQIGCQSGPVAENVHGMMRWPISGYSHHTHFVDSSSCKP